MSVHPAGWYKDPADPSQDLYWDGYRWTEHRRASRSTGAPSPEAPRPTPKSASAPHSPPAGWYKNPNNHLQQQYWDGYRWSGTFRATPEERTLDTSSLNSLRYLYFPGIGRAEYGLKLAIVTLWAIVGLGLSVAFRPAAYPPAGGGGEPGSATVNVVFAAVFLASWLTYTLVLRRIATKRVANAGISPRVNILLLFPYLQTAVAAALIFLPPRVSSGTTHDKIELHVRAHSEGEAQMLVATDIRGAADRGYYSDNEVWIPGRWSVGDFLIAAIACLVVVGILVLLAMLMIKPKGTLRITLRRGVTPVGVMSKTEKVPVVPPPAAAASVNAALVEMKSCPRCAEDVRAAALVCRFCGHNFSPA